MLSKIKWENGTSHVTKLWWHSKHISGSFHTSEFCLCSLALGLVLIKNEWHLEKNSGKYFFQRCKRQTCKTWEADGVWGSGFSVFKPKQVGWETNDWEITFFCTIIRSHRVSSGRAQTKKVIMKTRWWYFSSHDSQFTVLFKLYLFE